MWTLLAGCASAPEPAEGPLQPVEVSLITSLPDLERRLADPKALGAMILAAEGAVITWDQQHPAVLGAEVDLWLAIKPGGLRRSWVSGDVPQPDLVVREVDTSLAALPPPAVSGLVSLVIPMRRGKVESAGQPAIPPEWMAAYSGFETTETLILEVWPD